MLFYELGFESLALQDGLVPLGYSAYHVAAYGQCWPLDYGFGIQLLTRLHGINIRKINGRMWFDKFITMYKKSTQKVPEHYEYYD